MASVTAYNKAINTLQVGGVMWPGRQESTKDVPDDRVNEVRDHPLLEVKSEKGKTESKIEGKTEEGKTEATKEDKKEE